MATNESKNKHLIIKQVVFNPPFDILKKKADEVLGMDPDGGASLNKNNG